MCRKICTKANGLRKDSREKRFKILRSVELLVFKNTKWPTFVYKVKNATQKAVIYF